ncbi:MAG: hypothetical protein BZY88_08305 [SAR202 cluster bacterium Io17-Chloro-G9]|nr:MAG: hypothetical protein BZY88_08305 [SAR202 cluster bacterium Io17-Chloro-G9]
MNKEELMAKIGESIRRERTRKNLSRRELGELCGVSGQSIWSIESGRADPKVTTIAVIAEALGMEMAGIVPPLLPGEETIYPEEDDNLFLAEGLEKLVADFRARLLAREE